MDLTDFYTQRTQLMFTRSTSLSDVSLLIVVVVVVVVAKKQNIGLEYVRGDMRNFHTSSWIMARYHQRQRLTNCWERNCIYVFIVCLPCETPALCPPCFCTAVTHAGHMCTIVYVVQVFRTLRTSSAADPLCHEVLKPLTHGRAVILANIPITRRGSPDESGRPSCRDPKAPEEGQHSSRRQLLTVSPYWCPA